MTIDAGVPNDQASFQSYVTPAEEIPRLLTVITQLIREKAQLEVTCMKLLSEVRRYQQMEIDREEASPAPGGDSGGQPHLPDHYGHTSEG